MKQNNRQTSPFGRSTKADNAGLSLPTPIISKLPFYTDVLSDLNSSYFYFNDYDQSPNYINLHY